MNDDLLTQIRDELRTLNRSVAHIFYFLGFLGAVIVVLIFK